MARKIQIRRGSSSIRASKTPSLGEPYLDTTTLRVQVGDGATAGGVPIGGQLTLEPLGAIAGPNASSTITFPKGLPGYLGVGTVTGGGSDFTHKLVIPVANRIAGDVARFKIGMPISAHPTVSFHNDADTNSALATLAPDAVVARTYLVEFYFDGTAWQWLETRQQQ